MKKFLWLLFWFLIFIPVVFAGSKYNSKIGTKDFCVTVENQSGTIQNTSCTTVKLPDNTFFSHTDTSTNAVDYYFSTGINWDYTDVPAESINWVDIEGIVPTDSINWGDVENIVPSDSINWGDIEKIVPTDSINWDDITGVTDNKVLCRNSAGQISYCTSVVASNGTCTCP